MKFPELKLLITVQLSESECMALAQFTKRVGWNETRINAVSDEECYLMRDAIFKLQRALAEQGVNPR